jgi:hypothetical protein
MNLITSIYIPRMNILHSEDTIKKIMNHYKIGTVCYIDFTPINKKPGFGENVNQSVMSAFVHFSDPWLCSDNTYKYQAKNSDNSNYLYTNYTKNDLGNTHFWKLISTGKPAELRVNENEYWICLKNKNPVQRTMMNVHQIVENGRYLENLIQQQEQKIQELEKKLDSTNEVVNQLRCELNSSSKTDQGNECERRIDILEKEITRIDWSMKNQDTELLKRKHIENLIQQQQEEDYDLSTIESEPMEHDETESCSLKRLRNIWEIC